MPDPAKLLATIPQPPAFDKFLGCFGKVTRFAVIKTRHRLVNIPVSSLSFFLLSKSNAFTAKLKDHVSLMLPGSSTK